MGLAMRLAERGLMPEAAARWTLRRRLRRRIRRIERDTARERRELIDRIVTEMDAAPPVSPLPAGAPPFEIQRLVLGSRLKSTCCFWPAGTRGLDQAERAMLERTCRNAGIEDGMRVLDLDSGWGSLALWVAEAFPGSPVVAVCASTVERDHVRSAAAAGGLGRLEIVAASPLEFEPTTRFDRVLAIESLERTRNQRAWLRRVGAWLAPAGELLIQAACHRYWPYVYDPKDPAHWAATGPGAAGLMPSDDLVYRLAGDLSVTGHASFSGEHYQRSARAWLRNLEEHRGEIQANLGAGSASRGRLGYARLRLRYLACAEQFGLHRGQEWWVNHYRLTLSG